MAIEIITYNNAGLYIEDASTLEDRIKRLDIIIDALDATALTAAASGHIDEYLLEDGQSKVRTSYRNVTAIADAILAYERIKQMWINRLNKRVVNFRDSKAIRNGRIY